METPMSGWTLIPATSLVAAPWRNKLGTSRDIVKQPGPTPDSLGWTISIADLERDAVFSDYPNGDRIFTPIAGDPPPELAFSGGAFEACPLLVPKRFPGDMPTLSRIPAPGRAFNVIVDRRHYRASVAVLRLAAGDSVAAPAALHVVVHCLNGRLAIAGEVVGHGDSILGTGPGMPGTAAENGVAIVVGINAA
jgi:environmental stress-induced protein Ves